jgi:glycosyltransferase involved in cell wall biosynthesis
VADSLENVQFITISGWGLSRVPNELCVAYLETGGKQAYDSGAMQVLILDQFSDPGGAQQVLLELLPAMARRGWKAVVGLPGSGMLFRRVRELGFEAAALECGPFHSGSKSAADWIRLVRQLPRQRERIRGLAKSIRADLVYVNGPRLLPGTALATLQVPVLFHAHSYVHPGVSQRLAGSALRRMGARVVGSCRFVAEVWRAFVPRSQVSVIYNGVLSTAGIHRCRKATYTIGCVGRISPEKGQLEFVHAAREIFRVLPNCRFVIYGAPMFDDESAVRYAEQVRLAAVGLPVEFAGWVGDIQRVLPGLDLLMAPSAPYEATPRVIMEAFAAELPVIAFPSGGIPELIENNCTGFLARSVEEMASLAIELLTKDRERLETVAANAGAASRTKFAIERFHREVLDAMERAAGSASGDRAT